MGILDEAIREHLELKRQHGAGESELKQLEDEAFGPPARPGDPVDEHGQPPVADEPATELLTEPPAEPEAPADAEDDQSPAADAQVESTEPEPAPSPAGEELERQAIAEQPTEIFDVEGEYAAEAGSPSEEDLLAEEIAEPRLAPADSLEGFELAAEGESPEVTKSEPEGESTDPAADEDFEDDDFFSEQRLSEELDQALEAPRESAPDDLESEEPADLEGLEQPAGSGEEPLPPEAEEDEEPAPSAHLEEVREEPISEEAPREEHHEDVLEETPDFLEETPEDDELWFEQRPPKDFDFDD